MIKFKNVELEKQYSENKLDKRLEAFLHLLQVWIGIANDTIIITSIYRTPEENAEVNGYPTSKHMLLPSKAVDIRIRHLEDFEVTRMELLILMLKACGVPIGYYKHVGRNRHLHIQLND